MGGKTAGIVLLVVGVVVLLLFLLADVLGFGSPGFGLQQIGGTIVGAIVAVVGLVLTRKKG